MDERLKDLTVVKRSGQRVSFNSTKIGVAIKRAFDSVYDEYNEQDINKVYEKIVSNIEIEYKDRKTINVEDIQDLIEKYLEEEKFLKVYNSFREYRLRRNSSREAFQIKQQHKFVKAIEKIGYQASEVNDKKPNELQRKFSNIISKEFATSYLLENKIIRALEDGSIYVNDLKSYSLGNTSSSYINLNYIKTNDIEEFFNQIIYLVINLKNDQYKEHNIINFDKHLKDRLLIKYKETFLKEILNNLDINGLIEYIDINNLKDEIYKIKSIDDKTIFNNLKTDTIKNIYKKAYDKSVSMLIKILENNFKKMFTVFEAFLSNDYQKLLITFDNDSTYEEDIILDTYLKNLKPTNKIITNIFISNKNIENIVANIKENKNIYIILHNNKDISYFSEGEEIYTNINDSILTSVGRTLNSECTINLARIALKNKNEKEFFEELDYTLDIVKNALVQRYEMQANKYQNNFNVLFNPGLLFDSEKLEQHQKVRKVIRNGALFIGFNALYEASLILNETEEFNEKCLVISEKIIKFMKEKCNNLTNELKLNFMLKECLNKEISKNFIRMDKSLFGLKNQINKNNYEPYLSQVMLSKIDDSTKDKLIGKYQSITSSIYELEITKKMTSSKIIKDLDNLKDNKVKIVKITLK